MERTLWRQFGWYRRSKRLLSQEGQGLFLFAWHDTNRGKRKEQNTMSKIPHRFFLSEEEMPKQWYNLRADMKQLPDPMLNPQTLEPAKEEDLYPVFCKELAKQELDNTIRYVDIPEEIQEMYKIYRPSPLIRAYNLEKALDTPAKIYYKFEGDAPDYISRELQECAQMVSELDDKMLSLNEAIQACLEVENMPVPVEPVKENQEQEKKQEDIVEHILGKES